MAIRWAPWGEDAFARCRAEGKPLLLVLTASWCHACHRMDDETWDDPGVAAAVERAAVPVKVDADARPDVYNRYHLGGLPTTALLDAAGGFVRGGTALSPPELLRLLDLAVADWREERRPRPRELRAPAAPPSLAHEVVERLCRRADPEHGGFGVAPKLVEAKAVSLLLRAWRRSGDDRLERIARGALDAIIEHLTDPRDGGFFRYAAGADWSGPHTEKLALDQAEIIAALLEAAVTLAESRYLDAALGGLAHARRRLADAECRVLASVAADPPYHAGHSEEPPAVDARRFADASAAMVSAAAQALAMTGSESADAAAGPDASGDLRFCFELPAMGPDGCVPHRLDAAGVRGQLRDQALAISAAVAEYRLRGDRARLDWADRVAEWAIAHLWDDAAGAFRAAPEDAAVRLAPMYPLLANGEMALALIELAEHAGAPARSQRGGDAARLARADGTALTSGARHHAHRDSDDLREYTKRVVAALAGRAARSPAGAALALAALRLDDPAPAADVDGAPDDPRTRALAHAAIAALGPASVVRWTGAGAPAVTLCLRDRCVPDLRDQGALRAALIGLHLAPRGILAPWSVSSSGRGRPIKGETS